MIASLFASDLSRIARIEVILARMTLHHFAGFGHADTLGQGLVGFLFHTKVSKV